MLSLIKKIVFWDVIYEFVRKTPLFGRWHSINGRLASTIYGHPSRGMMVIGVTGTDGKTTTVNLIHHIIQNTLGPCLEISTASIHMGDQETVNTTKKSSLSPYQLQKLLALAKSQGIKYAVIETTSHGLDQDRFGSLEFAMGVLTNITPEHLDYHKTMDAYAATKKKLFQMVMRNPGTKLAILPKDDEYGRKRLDDFAFDKVVDYAVHINATIRAENIIEKMTGTEFDIKYLGKSLHVNTTMLASFNVYNALAALSAGLLLGCELSQMITSLSTFQQVNGRQTLFQHNATTYVVDFAHTPAGLQAILTYLNKVKGTGRIITVFGAPGLRDKEKRPLMGQVVDELSDVIILTEDDSMSEPRDRIIHQVTKGIQRAWGNNYHIVGTREVAVQLATQIAQPNDIVLLAGKGHEQALYTNYGTIPYNDLTTLKELLKAP